MSWAQLGLHAKPIGLLDVGGYWDLLLAWLDHGGRGGLRRAGASRLVRADLDVLLDSHRGPAAGRWSRGRPCAPTRHRRLAALLTAEHGSASPDRR